MTGKKVLLVSPHVTEQYSKTYIPELSENLGLGYVGGYLESKGVEVNIVDLNTCGTTLEQLAQTCKTEDYGIIGISANSHFYLNEALRFAHFFREKGINSHITLGGQSATFRDKEILSDSKDVDSIVRGEGEYTSHELYTALIEGRGLENILGLTYRKNSNIIRNRKRPAILELDQLPFPKRYNLKEIIEYHDGAHILTSRGCPGKCSFCVVPFHPGWRGRSPENVVDEIKELKELGAETFIIDDENYVGHCKEGRERAIEIARKIKERKLDIKYKVSLRADDLDSELLDILVDSGLYKVNIGIESFNQRQLDFYNKHISPEKNHEVIQRVIGKGIAATFSFIMFDPHVTPEELQVNHDAIRQYFTYFNFKKTRTYLKPVKGSSVWNQLRREGLLIEKEDHDDFYCFSNPITSRVFDIIGGFRRDMKPTEKRYEEFSNNLILLKKDREFQNMGEINGFKKQVDETMTLMWLDILQHSIDFARKGIEVPTPKTVIERHSKVGKIFDVVDEFCGGIR
jgi:anaerobic magnesium-protoporphyrin IX monomethyl ester cyclase